MLLVEGGKACRAQSRTLRRGVGVRLLSSCGTAGFGCGSGAMLPGEEAPAVPTQHPRHPRQVRPPSSAGLRLRPLGPRGALLHSRLAGYRVGRAYAVVVLPQPATERHAATRSLLAAWWDGEENRKEKVELPGWDKAPGCAPSQPLVKISSAQPKLGQLRSWCHLHGAEGDTGLPSHWGGARQRWRQGGCGGLAGRGGSGALGVHEVRGLPVQPTRPLLLCLSQVLGLSVLVPSPKGASVLHSHCLLRTLIP